MRLSYKEKFIKKAKEKHNDFYNYSLVEYINSKTPVEIICPKHGIFLQRPALHVFGHGCKKCGYEKNSRSFRKSKRKFILEAAKVHNGVYDYSLAEYKTTEDKIKIKCLNHGIFLQTPHMHLLGNGCPECKKDSLSKNHLKTTEDFIKKATELHKSFYNYSLVDYKNNKTPVEIICPKHGRFLQRPDSHIAGKGCSKCFSGHSKGEKEVVGFLKEIGVVLIENERTILEGKELDIYIPDKKTAIEFNGLYWHSEEKGKSKNYHLNKTLKCKEKGIVLIHIFEDEWFFKKEIVKSRIKAKLSMIDKSIYARKCSIREIEASEKNIFLEENHIQGKDRASIKLGAFFEDDLVGVMTFCSPRIALGKKSEDGVFELSRFATKKNFYCVGLASKMLKNFERNEKVSKIYTYSDLRWNSGKVYEKMGFTYIGRSDPGYWYIVNHKRKHRFSFRKSELEKKLDFYDKSLTESENMKLNKIDKIWDCGNFKFEKIFKEN